MHVNTANDAAGLLAHARSLRPDIFAHRAEIEAGRKIPPSLVDALREAQLLELWLPRRSAGRNSRPLISLPWWRNSRAPTARSAGARRLPAFATCSRAACPSLSRARFSKTAKASPEQSTRPARPSRSRAAIASPAAGPTAAGSTIAHGSSATASFTTATSRAAGPRRPRNALRPVSARRSRDHRHLARQRAARHRQP